MALFSQNRWLKITVRLALFFRASGSLVSEFTNSLAIYKEEVADDDSYTGKDEKGEYKLQLLRKWGSNSRRIDRPNLYFGVDFEGETVFPILPDGSDGCWRWSKSKIESAIKENLIVFLHSM